MKQTFRGGIIGIISKRAKISKFNKILFVIGSLKTGGAENHLAQLASGLKKRGWDVEIYLLSPYVEVDAKYLDKCSY